MTNDVQQAWERALEILRRLVPGALAFNVDQVAAAAKAAQRPLRWKSVPGARDVEDEVVWDAISASLAWNANATVTVVVDTCHSSGLGPFVVPLRELREWLFRFSEAYRDEVFAGDAFFLCGEGGVLFHHEGLFAIIGEHRLPGGRVVE